MPKDGNSFGTRRDVLATQTHFCISPPLMSYIEETRWTRLLLLKDSVTIGTVLGQTNKWGLLLLCLKRSLIQHKLIGESQWLLAAK